ncbi:4-formylbenzenesulfonate dehydrogenase TsaC1/TsaC2 [Pseudomonas fluorescens]|jgi:NAD(P)-dependent dehydrogenase (short-subunit alcohol dehydrogenase family)|uniref:SDR family NAD(P)-dependent oxidoreductase n=1 Tax=Pseudomonas fluorescens TaxID=294 RepID=UPI001241618C|nr:SDR family NAD(P)-dependent oxidoreductase [Pseudomonas fluorescens]VVP89204.1 4-formylbenzenesulfonate dehydrogenase TsaC1/TsaC2 [Pseudomonas fluorescens]
MMDFTGKTVLVTGGGAGIGRAIVEAFARAGARLVVAEVDATRAADVRSVLDCSATETLVVKADVTVKEQVADLAEQVQARFGGLDVLVNNVGDSLMIAKPFDAYSDDDIDRLYAVNLQHIFRVTRAMLPLLRRQGAGSSIISLSSIEGFRGIPNCSVYAAFKSAISGFTKSLALELGPVGIRVNQIAPESTETAQLPMSMMIAAEHQGQIPQWIPLGRFGKAEDMAGAALFLASSLSGWVTGTTLHVDGGALAAAGWYRAPNGTWTNVPVISGNGFNF